MRTHPQIPVSPFPLRRESSLNKDAGFRVKPGMTKLLVFARQTTRIRENPGFLKGSFQFFSTSLSVKSISFTALAESGYHDINEVAGIYAG